MSERICNFVPQESIKKIVDEKYQEIKSMILSTLPNVEIEHVGSSAVKGVLTKKDLDITVRAEISEFQKCIDAMEKMFKAVHKDVWQYNKNTSEGMAIFTKQDNYLESIDIMLVVKGSRFDEYHIFREILEKDDCVRQDYNALKKAYQGKPYKEG